MINAMNNEYFLVDVTIYFLSKIMNFLALSFSCFILEIYFTKQRKSARSPAVRVGLCAALDLTGLTPCFGRSSWL